MKAREIRRLRREVKRLRAELDHVHEVTHGYDCSWWFERTEAEEGYPVAWTSDDVVANEERITVAEHNRRLLAGRVDDRGFQEYVKAKAERDAALRMYADAVNR